MNKIIRRLVSLVILLPLIYLAYTWKNIPATVAIHFDINGNIDRYAPKKELLIIVAAVTGVNVLTYLLLVNVYRIDPKKYAYQNRQRMEKIAFTVAVFLSAVFMLIIYSSVHASLAFSISIMLAGVFFLFALIGNYMYNIKPNYFAGFRLPWTLSNEENWRKTHQLAGRLWFYGGLIAGIIVLFLPQQAAIIAGAAIMAVLIVVPVVYSYRLYKQHRFVE